MKHRTQVQLEKWQYEALKSLAREKDISLSEALRRILDRELPSTKQPKRKKREELAGFFSDPQGAGRDHDRYLYR